MQRHHNEILQVASPLVFSLLLRLNDLCLHVCARAVLFRLQAVDECGPAGGAAAAETCHVCETVLSQEEDIAVYVIGYFEVSSDVFVSVAYKLRRIDVSLGWWQNLFRNKTAHFHQNVHCLSVYGYLFAFAV